MKIESSVFFCLECTVDTAESEPAQSVNVATSGFETFAVARAGRWLSNLDRMAENSFADIMRTIKVKRASWPNANEISIAVFTCDGAQLYYVQILLLTPPLRTFRCAEEVPLWGRRPPDCVKC